MRPATVLLLLSGVAFSGCLNEFDAPAPNDLRVAKVIVAAPVVTSGFVMLAVDTTLDNGGGKSGPVIVEATAFDTATQLLAARNETALGSIPKDRTVTVRVGLDVPRVSGYRIDVVVFERDRALRTASVSVSNVAGIPPNLHETALQVSSMDFHVRNASNNRVSIVATTYVTNEGAGPSQPLRMQLKAREVSTDLVADEAWADIKAVGPEETVAHEITLNVPAGYNYEMEAVLWDGSYIVETGSGRVQLLPTFTKPTGADLVVASPDIRDFERGGAPAPGSAENKTPGLGVVLVVAALAVAIVAVSRRN